MSEYTPEKYREVLISIYGMDSTEQEKAFGVDESIYGYLKDFPPNELIEKYMAYKKAPKIGEYWGRKEDGQMVVVRYIKSGVVFYYYCSDGVSDYASTCNFVKTFTRTKCKSKYLKDFIEEMKDMNEAGIGTDE